MKSYSAVDFPLYIKLSDGTYKPIESYDPDKMSIKRDPNYVQEFKPQQIVWFATFNGLVRCVFHELTEDPERAWVCRMSSTGHREIVPTAQLFSQLVTATIYMMRRWGLE